MKNKITVIAMIFMLPLMLPASDPDTAGMKRLFDGLEKALTDQKEADFKKLWHPEGYKDNLAGGGGLAGKEAYAQAIRKKWVMKPDMKQLLQADRGGPFIIPCRLWSEEKQQFKETVYAIPVYDHALKKWILLAAGKNKEEIFALARRYQNKQPLKQTGNPE